MSSGVSAPSSGCVAGSSGVSVQTNTFTSVHHHPHQYINELITAQEEMVLI